MNKGKAFWFWTIICAGSSCCVFSEGKEGTDASTSLDDGLFRGAQQSSPLQKANRSAPSSTTSDTNTSTNSSSTPAPAPGPTPPPPSGKGSGKSSPAPNTSTSSMPAPAAGPPLLPPFRGWLRRFPPGKQEGIPIEQRKTTFERRRCPHSGRNGVKGPHLPSPPQEPKTYWDHIASSPRWLEAIHKKSAECSSGDKECFHLAMQKYHKARVDYGAAMQEHEKALKAFQEKTEKNDHDGAKESHELAFQKYTEAQKLVHEMREAQKQAKTYADKHTRDNEFTIFPKEVGGGHRGGSPRGRFGPFPWEKEWPENTTFHAWEVTKLADRIQKMGDSTKSWPGKGDHIESLKCEQEREKAANAYAEALQTHHGAHQAMNKERADFHLKRAQEHRAKIEEHHRKAEGKRPRCGPGCKWHGPHHRH